MNRDDHHHNHQRQKQDNTTQNQIANAMRVKLLSTTNTSLLFYLPNTSSTEPRSNSTCCKLKPSNRIKNKCTCTKQQRRSSIVRTNGSANKIDTKYAPLQSRHWQSVPPHLHRKSGSTEHTTQPFPPDTERWPAQNQANRWETASPPNQSTPTNRTHECMLQAENTH